MKNASSRKLIRAAQLAVFMCALPALAGEDIYGLGDGHNGSQTLGTGIINLYAKVSAPAAPGDTTITVSSNPGIVIGDLIMVLQTTGIVPEPASGTPGPIDLSNDPVGRWELARVSGVSGATPTVLTMTQPLLYSYAANVTQVIRVPEYVNVTIGGTSSVGARPWNGSIGGVLAFLATGTVTVNATISVTSLGFRGGQPVLDNSTTTTCSGLDQPAPTGAQKGEGIAVTRYGTSQTGRGRVASGGGGGVCVKSGGGGGGNGGAGGDGGNDGNRVVGGQGGTALIAPSLTRLLLGGGGGPGHIRNSPTAAGGTGGGIVFIRANNLTGTGSILADGFYSADISSDDGGGGGGAGGTIHIRLQGTAQCSPSKIHAKGEHGGSIASALTGPGGGGGGGRILLQACGGAPLCPLTASAVAGGPQGIQQSTADPYGAQMGGNGDFTLIPECYYPLTAPVVVTPPNNSSTNNSTPTYSGTLATPFSAGTQVAIYVDGVEIGRVTPDAAGNWSFTQPTALADGTHSVYAIAINSPLQSGPSNTNTFKVDTVPPAAPVVLAPANGSTTSNNKPTYSGTAEAGSTVTVYVDGTVVGTTTANASGAWSFTPATALADGTHSVRATATDAAGNTGPFSNTNSFTVDTTPPVAPVVLVPANGSVTGNNKPTYSGTAEAGTTVTVIVDGVVLGTTTASASGTWSFPQTTALADGTHTVKARATDAVGNTSADSNTNSFTVDTTPPAAPVVVTPANGSTISNNKPAYSGTAEPGSTVTVIVDGTTVGTATADAAGAWNFTQPTALADGTHSVKARATDSAGNTSVDSNTNSFTVDTTPPAAPVVVAPANGSVTSNNKPAYSGTAEPGSTVTVIIDGTTVGTTTANASGAWSFTQPTALADGTHSVKARATDSAGNTSVDSNTNSFTVDTTPPAAPVVVAPANGSVTSNNKPAYSGTAEPGSTVTVIVDGTVVGTTTANAAGAWSFTQTTALADGTHTVKAHATDAVGNTGPDSNTNSFTVDTTAPAAPVVIAPANGSTTSNNKPAYSGTAEPGSTVTVIVDGTVVGTTTANALGAWSSAQPTALADGTHTVKVRATDALGNTGPDSNTNSFTVDTTPPAAPVVVAPANGSVSSNNKPTYSGTAEPGSTVTVIVDGTVVGTTTADAAGAWSFTSIAALADGTHTVKAHATDAVGNTGPDSNTNSFTVDTTAPAAPVVVAPANGSTTSNNKPAYSGTAEAGSTVTVIVDGATVGTTTANASGAWSFPQTTALADGTHTVKARATDALGNTGPDSNTNSFTVDTTAPAAPVVVAPANGSITSNNKPTYSGTAEPGSTVTIIVDGATVGPTTANASGTWSFTSATALGDGVHTVKARATDAVGNTGPDSNTNSFTVDTTAPAAPVVVAPANGSTTSNNKPAYSGTAEAGSTVTVIVDGAAVGTTTANASGAWNFTPIASLADGVHTVKATAADAAGNTSPDSNTNSFTVDTTAPAAPTVATPANGSTTNDNTPTYSGTAEAGSTVTVIVDGAVVGPTTASASGTWSFTPTAGLLNGPHTVKATATDAAGNTSPGSNTNSFTVDTIVPAAPVVITPPNGSVTSNNRPTYSGTAEAGSTVTVYVDGTAVGPTTADASGNWSLTPATALADGVHTVKATATDEVGNTSPDSSANSFTVDTTAPAAPVVTAPANGSVSSNNKPAYSGTAEAGSTVTVIVDGTAVGTTTANASGAWSLAQTTALADGVHTVKATATDTVGNTGPASNTNSFTVDTTAPAAPVVVAPADGSTLNRNRPTYSGTAEAGSTVTVIVDGAAVGTVKADAAGAWSLVSPAALSNGLHTVKATATDAVGNTSPESNTNTFTVDATIPPPPVVVTPENNSVTHDTTPTISGTSELNSTVTISLGTQELGTVQTDASGHWSFTPTTPLAEGSYDVSAVATNPVGNTGERSNVNHFTIDTTPPGAPVVTRPVNDSVTQDTTPTLSGTAEPNSTVTVSLNGSAVGTTTADTTGNWSLTPTTPLADGTYTVTATATDVAGNTSLASSPVRFFVDTTPPETTIVSAPSGQTENPDASFDFSSNESNVTYECSLDGAAFAACSDPVTFSGVAEGDHTLQVRARDAVGNVDPTPASATWTYQPPPPDWALLGTGVGCASAGGDPSSLAMMGLAVLSALVARKRRE